MKYSGIYDDEPETPEEDYLEGLEKFLKKEDIKFVRCCENCEHRDQGCFNIFFCNKRKQSVSCSQICEKYEMSTSCFESDFEYGKS
jgi:hypothetical protein